MELVEKLKAQESARSIVYRRLSDTYRSSEPGPALGLQELEKALVHLCSDSLEAVKRLRKDCADQETRRSLEVEHTRLFLGPFLAPAPPYGSIYLERGRRLMGNSTVDAREHYLRSGLDVASDRKEAPDHISTELEFMYALIRQSLQFLEAAEYGALSENLLHQRLFLEKHLGAWVPLFADSIVANARIEYFRCLATVTRIFIAEDLDLLPSPSPAQAEWAGVEA